MRSQFETIDQLQEAQISDTILPIMEMGLRAAIISNHDVSIRKILSYAKKELLIITID